ncbi:CHAP domain-containing protein [Nonomuraea angiospora]
MASIDEGLLEAALKHFGYEFAYTVDHAKWFQAQGAWSDRPEPGAIVFYDWSGSKDVEGIDHAGIVERVDGERIATIEGNIDKVWLKRKDRDQSKVVGYGLPRKVREKAGGGDGEVVILEGELGSSPEQPAAFGKAVPPKAAVAAVAPALGEAMPLVDAMAVPVGALAALLGAVLVIRRARKRQFARPSSAGGRHRRTGGRHQTLAT